MNVVVLGCGPAGLMAAQGVLDACKDNYEGGLRLSIISRKKKSPLYGAQYLHSPIPGFTPPEPKIIGYTLRGSTDDYRRKVYGQMYNGTVSPEDLDQEHMGWDIRATYDLLWEHHERFIIDAEVDTVGLRNIMAVGETDLIINSIPRQSLCYTGHHFGITTIWAAGDAPELGIKIPYSCPEGMVICNGEDNPAWYRMSRVYGHTTVEWPSNIMNVPVATAAIVSKPVDTNCDCFSDVLHVGRYGRWEKGVLSHTAYFDAYKKVDEMLGVSSAAAEI